MDPQLTSIQPGGGAVMQLELLWGRWRRWWLKTFRRGYVTRMSELRRGDGSFCPHEVLDPRDVKFYCNQGERLWDPSDDPFAGRDRLPFARIGLAELLLGSLATFGPAALLAGWTFHAQLEGVPAYVLWTLVSAFVVIGLLVVWFFRDPERKVPEGAGLIVSPADGVIASIDEREGDEFVEGPVVVVGIFLSIFNVHLNRMPVAGRVIGLKYTQGKFLNALRPASARENEQLAARIEANAAPYRRLIVRQIAGAIARRIVCWVKPGDELDRGERFGMIKFGSRTELVLPREKGLEIKVKIGQKVHAGASVLAEYEERTL